MSLKLPPLEAEVLSLCVCMMLEAQGFMSWYLLSGTNLQKELFPEARGTNRITLRNTCKQTLNIITRLTN